MKLMHCIFAICIVTAVESAPATRDELENLGKLILSNIEHASEEIDQFINDVQGSVKDIILNGPIVLKVKNTLNEKLARVEPGSMSLLECSVRIGEQLNNMIIPSITENLLQKLIKQKYGLSGDYFSLLKKKLSELKDVLKNHVDEEINSCLGGKNKCKLETEFIGKGQEYFNFQSGIKPSIHSAIKLSDDYFHSAEANKILDSFSKQAYECLLG